MPYFLPGRPIDFAADYENLAQFVARHFGCTVPAGYIDGLLRGYYPETLESIYNDQPAFDARVNAYLYADAMATAPDCD